MSRVVYRLTLIFLFSSIIQFGYSQIKGLDLLNNEDELILPFEYKNGFVLLTVKYNNFLPLIFIVDTGAEHTILFERALNDLFGLPYDQTVQILGSDLSEIMYAFICRNVPIRLSDNLTVNRDIVVLEEDKMRLDEITGIPIDGIIGASFFRNLIVRFNFRKNQIHFYHPDRFDYSELNEHNKLSVTIKNGKPYLDTQTTVNAENSGEKLELLVDTGASIPLLLHNREGSEIELPQKVIPGNLAMGLGGSLKGYVGKVKKLEMGIFKFENLISYFQTLKLDSTTAIYQPDRDGIIGTELLSRFDLYIDYLNDHLYLKPNKNFRKKFNYDRSGLILLAFGPKLDKFYVKRIIPNSPASDVGVKEGDIITRISIWNTRFFTLEKILKKLSGKEGKRIRLTIDRNGQKLKKEIKLRDLI